MYAGGQVQQEDQAGFLEVRTNTESRTSSLSSTVILQLFICALLLVGGAVRFIGIGTESLAGDEVFSANTVKLPSTQMMDAVRWDLVHPPLYYFVLRTWTAVVGFEKVDLRFPSLVAGLGVIVLLAFAGQLYRPMLRPSCLAAGLLALNAGHIYYSQEVRSYALFVFLSAMLLVWGWVQTGETGQTMKSWCIGAAIMIALLYTHYYGVFYVICIASSLALTTGDRRRRLRSVLTALVALVTLLPWLAFEFPVYVAKKGLNQNLGWVGVPTGYDLKAIWASYVGIPEFTGGTTLALVVGCGVVAAGLLVEFRGRRTVHPGVLVALAFTAFLPPLLAFVLSSWPFYIPMFGPRHLLPSIVPFLILLSFGGLRLAAEFRISRLMVTAVASCFVLLQLAPLVKELTSLPRRTPFDRIAQDLRRNEPVYTTWTYGIGAPIGFATSGSLTLRDLPVNKETLPSSLTVLYRPNVSREQRKVALLLGSGYRVAETHSYNTVQAATLTLDKESR